MVVMETAEQERKSCSPTFLKRFFELVERGCWLEVLVEKKFIRFQSRINSLFSFEAVFQKITRCVLIFVKTQDFPCA